MMTSAVVYVGTMLWKNLEAIHCQIITSAWEEKKSYDQFTVSGPAKIPGKLGDLVVGHIPQELTR